MPRYHLHLIDGQTLLDIRGDEFPDLEAAKAEAAARLKALRASKAYKHHAKAIRIADDNGNEVARVA
ncbi:MAG: hypothetical protein JO254_02535 [Pseudolabrys sp.]|nr:hypothetical protein [Pseudolabrys sp.]